MRPFVLVAAGLALACTDAPAYEIVSSRYHVEVAPNQFVDQLVLRCEDGKTLTVPWQAKLAEACGEDLMGNVRRQRAKANSAPVDDEQKQAMMKQLKSHYSTVQEKDVEFTSGPEGVTAHFTPDMVEILKKYEICRKTHRDKATCAIDRDRAMQALSAKPEAPAESGAQASEGDSEAAPQPSIKTAKHNKPSAAKVMTATATPHAKKAERIASPTVEHTPMPAENAHTAPSHPAAPSEPPPMEMSHAAPTAPSEPPAETRAEIEQRIATAYTACMRNKPKLECEQARKKAFSEIDRRPAKPRSYKPA